MLDKIELTDKLVSVFVNGVNWAFELYSFLWGKDNSYVVKDSGQIDLDRKLLYKYDRLLANLSEPLQESAKQYSPFDVVSSVKGLDYFMGMELRKYKMGKGLYVSKDRYDSIIEDLILLNGREDTKDKNIGDIQLFPSGDVVIGHNRFTPRMMEILTSYSMRELAISKEVVPLVYEMAVENPIIFSKFEITQTSDYLALKPISNSMFPNDF